MSDTESTPAPAGPPVPSPRQTLSYLRGLFEAHGLEAKTKLGQNFLIDLNLVDLIVRAAELDRSDAVLEVGTGTGSLTAKLAIGPYTVTLADGWALYRGGGDAGAEVRVAASLLSPNPAFSLSSPLAGTSIPHNLISSALTTPP